jgi:hypothetical protein
VAETVTDPATNRVEYSIIRPPGWKNVRITEAAVRDAPAFVARATAGVPEQNRATLRGLLGPALQKAVRDALKHGGQDLIYPTEPVEGMLPPLSIVVSVPPLPVAKGLSQPDALLSFAAGDAGATATSIGPALAVRRSAEAAPQKDAAGVLIAPASRRLSYLIAVPGDTRTLLVVGTILRIGGDAEQQIVDALELLFDSMVGTIKFERRATAVGETE